MDRKECANGLQLIRIASLKLRGHFSAVFMGCLAMTTPLILALVVPMMMALLMDTMWLVTVGLVIFMLLLGPLQVGNIKYYNAVLDGKQPRLRMVYSQFNFSFFTIRTIYITVLLVLMYIIGGAVYILPAGFAVSFFSMIPFFMEKFEYDRLSVAMKDTAKKMMGNRLAMFSYKLIFYLVYFMLFIVCLLIVMLVSSLALDNLIISWVVAVCGIIVFVFLYTFVTVYYHSSNQIFFEDVLTRHEKKKASKAKVATVNLAMHDAENSQEKLTEKEIKPENTVEKEVEKDSGAEKKTPTKSSKSTKAAPVKSSKNTTTKSTKKPASKSATKAKSTGKKTTKKMEKLDGGNE